jgi:hypothetical protein
MTVNRRDVLFKGGAAAAALAAGTTAPVSAEAQQSPPQWDRSALNTAT